MKLKKVQIISIAVWLTIVIFALVLRNQFSVSNIQNLIFSFPHFSIVIFLALYALKSLSVVLPVMLLMTSSGLFFPFPTAFCVNVIGSLICFTVSYWMGYLNYNDTFSFKKNEKVQYLIEKNKEHQNFLAFFLRIVRCFPMDIVSIHFGVSGMPFLPYLFFSLLGLLPEILLSTLLGASVANPNSPNFLISIGCAVILSAVSLVGYYFYYHCNQNRKEDKL